MAHDPGIIDSLLAAKCEVARRKELRERYRIAAEPCSRHGQALLGIVPREEGLACPECAVERWGESAAAPVLIGNTKTYSTIGRYEPLDVREYLVERVKWAHSGGWGIDWAWRVPE